MQSHRLTFSGGSSARRSAPRRLTGTVPESPGSSSSLTINPRNRRRDRASSEHRPGQRQTPGQHRPPSERPEQVAHPPLAETLTRGPQSLRDRTSPDRQSRSYAPDSSLVPSGILRSVPATPQVSIQRANGSQTYLKKKENPKILTPEPGRHLILASSAPTTHLDKQLTGTGLRPSRAA